MEFKKTFVLMVTIALFTALPFCSNVQTSAEQREEDCNWEQQIGTIEYEQCRLRHLNERLKEFHDLIKGFLEGTKDNDELKIELQKLKQPAVLRLGEQRGIVGFMQALQDFKTSHSQGECGRFEFRVLSYFIRNIPFADPLAGTATDAQATIGIELKCITPVENETIDGEITLLHILRCRWD